MTSRRSSCRSKAGAGDGGSSGRVPMPRISRLRLSSPTASQQAEAVVRRAASVSKSEASAAGICLPDWALTLLTKAPSWPQAEVWSPREVESMKAPNLLSRLSEVPDGRPIPEIATMTPWAGLKLALPSCAAVIVHTPVPPRDAVFPETEHGPEAENETDSPDVAVAVIAKGGSPKILSASGAKLMDWSCLAVTVKDPRNGVPPI